MTRLTFVIVSIAVSTLAAAIPAKSFAQALGTSDNRFEVGRPFPELTLPSLEDGRPRSISEFRGRKLILHIFASW